jgi:malate dehydrogenase (oxaloacetate-decarboxylating)
MEAYGGDCMVGTGYKIIRTLRCKNANLPGTLGKLATTIGEMGASIGNVSTVHLGPHFNVRDIEVLADSEEHLTELVVRVSKLREVSVLEVRDDVLEVHKNGKIKMVNTVPIGSMDDLSRVYTPGVAEVCTRAAHLEGHVYADSVFCGDSNRRDRDTGTG